MKSYSAFAFGFGRRVARVADALAVVDDVNTLGLVGRAVVFREFPGRSYVREVYRPGIEFAIVPHCSLYSHLAAMIWSADVPAIAIDRPSSVPINALLLADFDAGTLLIAESVEDEAELMASWVAGRPPYLGSPNLGRTSSPRSSIDVLPEVATRDHLLRALSNGSRSIGVINAESVSSFRSADDRAAHELLDALTSCADPMQVQLRFFDVEVAGALSAAGPALPRVSFGYRGVRVVGTDSVLMDRYAELLKRLAMHQIVVVLPMVATSEEVLNARRQLGLTSQGLGITVETPAAALSIAELCEVVDFVQIGLNDLTQYTMAWDRDVINEDLMPRNRIAGPVASLIRMVSGECRCRKIPCTLGLDLRPSFDIGAQLLDLGVSSISCAPALVPHWNEVISNLECVTQWEQHSTGS